MSYPFQGGPENHPYPPSMSYPTAPSMHPGNNPYPPQNTSIYPPLPSLHGPQYPSSTPYPLTNPTPNPGYPTSNPYPPSNPAYPTSTPYPPSNPSYPPSNPGYPQSNPGYPPSNPGYPPSNPSYPPSNPGYPPSNPGYTPSNPGYPPSNPGYPPSIPGYPTSNPYPPSNPPSSNINPYPPSNPGYPHSGHSGGSGSVHGSHPSSHYDHSGHHKSSPTVKPASNFDSQNDAAILRKAMKGFGTDEAAIIGVLSKRTNAQRQEIAKDFKTLYGKDLISDLKSETSGKFEQLLVALMTPIDQYYAHEVHNAISGIGTNEGALIEVLCTLSNAEIQYVKAAYEKLYKTKMESDLASDTSGNFKRLMVSLCVGRRDESAVVINSAAESDAIALHRAGALRFGTDESTFNAILCTRNYAQLAAIFQAYEKISGHKFEKAIKSEFSGDIEEGLLAITKCVMNKALFFAECLHGSMAGLGTNDRALIRLMVTRSEIDLGEIKKQYQIKYKKTLESDIKGDTSGDYKKMLIALLG